MMILRSSPRKLNMTLGRAVTNLVAPPPCDSLPDVVLYKTPSGQLGGTCLCVLGRYTKLFSLATSEFIPHAPPPQVSSSQEVLAANGRASTVWRWCQAPQPVRKAASNPMIRSSTSVGGAPWV